MAREALAASRRSLDYSIAKWDPRHTGLLEEDHHNTYDISYFGPDGHCGSFYLGALAAAIEMGSALDEDVDLYGELLAKGTARMETELWNGEYFIQKVVTKGLDQTSAPSTRPDSHPLPRGGRESQPAGSEVPVRHRLPLRRRARALDGTHVRNR